MISDMEVCCTQKQITGLCATDYCLGCYLSLVGVLQITGWCAIDHQLVCHK